jgi:hypothetical protein
VEVTSDTVGGAGKAHAPGPKANPTRKRHIETMTFVFIVNLLNTTITVLTVKKVTEQLSHREIF